MNNGKIVIVAMAIVAVTMAGFAWWMRWTRSQEVLAHWGRAAAITIRNGDEVWLLELETRSADENLAENLAENPAENPAENLTVELPGSGATDSQAAERIAIPAAGQGSVDRAAGESAGAWLAVQKMTNITDSRGLIHARHSLLHHKGFAWDAAPSDDCEPNWELGMRFRRTGETRQQSGKHEIEGENDHVATMLFDFQCNRVYLVERNVEVSMEPIAPAMKEFLRELVTK